MVVDRGIVAGYSHYGRVASLVGLRCDNDMDETQRKAMEKVGFQLAVNTVPACCALCSHKSYHSLGTCLFSPVLARHEQMRATYMLLPFIHLDVLSPGGLYAAVHTEGGHSRGIYGAT
jgi:hypothetical protein